MADDDKDEKESGSSLTPEQRIAKLEKGKTISLILIIVLMVFSLVQFAGIGYLVLKPAKDPQTEKNTVQLATQDAKLLELQKAQNKAEQIILQNEILKAKLDKVLADANIQNYANLRSALVDMEIDHMAFIKALEQGMYELSRMIRGSRTWFEVYKEELDKIQQHSEARISKIEAQSSSGPSKAAPSPNP